MTPKPLPRQSFDSFCKSHARATEILNRYFGKTQEQRYRMVFQNPFGWQEFKFLTKHLEISLKSLSEAFLCDEMVDWYIMECPEAGYYIDRAFCDWEKAGLSCCPDNRTMEKYYTNV